MFKRDIDYIVKDDKIVIIDEFTGRMMDGRRWSNGLHQAVEAKEGVQIEPENQTMASITFQNYFRMYPKLSRHDRHRRDRGGRVLRHLQDERRRRSRPTCRCSAIDEEDEFYKNTARQVPGDRQVDRARSSEIGQPVLVGTVSIEKSELLVRIPRARKASSTRCSTPASTRWRRISSRRPGRLGAVTIATNMAGRGTDIQLGGNVEFRIEDELERHAPKGPSATPRSSGSRPRSPPSSEQVLAAGGLFVLGTERHESRRIDNQLRGRSGRQGDPGLSQFYLCLEDDLLRIFGPDTLFARMMNSQPRRRRGDRLASGCRRRSRPRRRRSRRATTTSASRSSNTTT